MKDKIKAWTVRFLAGIGALTVAYIALIVFLVATLASGSKGAVPDKVILEWELRALPGEIVAESLASITGAAKTMNLRQTVAALDAAAGDSRVEALLLKVRCPDEGLVGLAAAQEIRGALRRFRDAGKPVVAWTDTFSEAFTGNLAYYIACAADEIKLQPSGDVALTGLVIEHPFIKEALAEYGIKIEALKRHEYKSALDFATETGFTDANREAMQTVVNSQVDQILEGVASGRSLETAGLRQLIDEAPYPAAEALEKKLIDATAYHDEVVADLKKRFPEAELLYLEKYYDRAGDPWTEPEALDTATVALVYGVGNVLRGRAEPSFTGDSTLSSETVAASIRAAAEDDGVKAILFRVDSPGGSYVASDTVWREVVLARQKGKPVVASMGRLAASGGYFVSMPADRILAQPGTLTGSIGVIAGLPRTEGFWDRLHVNWERVQVGDNAALMSGAAPLNDAQRAKFKVWLDEVYDDFVTKAAEGRGMTREQMHQFARGRVWTGRDALTNGLIDAEGGYHEALAACRELAKIPESTAIELKLFPEPKELLEQFLDQGPDSSDDTGSEPFQLSLGIPRELVETWMIWQQVRVGDGAVLRAPLNPSR